MVKLEMEVDVDGTLDLSMLELEEVPLKEILALKRTVKKLDLSNNQLTSLQPTFASQLSQLVYLDLSKNKITEVPDDFGVLTGLVHLDLYSNKIERLPLSFKKLTKLRWLDLKDNPLTPQLAKIAGPCVDQADCQKCARDVVLVMQEISKSIEQEKQRKQDERQQGAPKEKKKKRKNKQGGGNNSEAARTDTSSTDTKTAEHTPAEKHDKLGATANGVATAHAKTTCSLPARLCWGLTRAVVYSILITVLFIGGLYIFNLPESQPIKAKIEAQYESLRKIIIQYNIPEKYDLCVAWIQKTTAHTSAVLQDFFTKQAPVYAQNFKMLMIHYFEVIKSQISQITNSSVKTD